MKAEIVSIGTEILLGQITDTNASYLAAQLPLLGIDLFWVSQVGDNQLRLVEVLKRAWQRSDLILTTGGLGPTGDDITRETVAKMLGEELKTDPVLEQWLKDLFARRGIKMAPNNIKQAAVVPSAEPIPNERGTAPGWWVEKDGRILVAMPGPPREMHNMWDVEVLPRLRKKATDSIIHSKTVKVYGFPEGTVDNMISPLLSSTNPTIGVYAKPDGIHLRFTAKAQNQQQAEELVAQGEAKVRSIFGEAIWGTDDDALVSTVGNMLTEKGLSLATMEYCTGGLLTATITDNLDNSAWFKGGLVVYSNEALKACGVNAVFIDDYGVVSSEMAQLMAEISRLRLQSDIGLSITGVIGPDELDGQPGGTMYIGLDNGKDKKTKKRNYRGDRSRVKNLVTVAALFELRRMLLALDQPKSL